MCFTNSDISLRVVSLVFRGLDLLKIANINPQQEARFSLWKKLVLRESDENGLTCVRSQSSREVKNVTIKKVSLTPSLN